MTIGRKKVLRILAATAATAGMLGSLAVIGVLFWWHSRLVQDIPGDAGPGHPVTITAKRGDVVNLAPPIDDHSAQCTIRPATGETRSFTVIFDPQTNTGTSLEVWWDGEAQLDCDRLIGGTVGGPYSRELLLGGLCVVLIFVFLAIFFGFLAIGGPEYNIFAS